MKGKANVAKLYACNFISLRAGVSMFNLKTAIVCESVNSLDFFVHDLKNLSCYVICLLLLVCDAKIRQYFDISSVFTFFNSIFFMWGLYTYAYIYI